MSSPILCNGLTKRFRRIVAVRDLDMEIPEGSIYALIGPNGAGKTTLIKMLVNILGPTSGHAMVLGIDSRRLAAREFASLGYVSENQELPEWMTVQDLLEYLKPFYPTWDDALAEELIGELELPRNRKLRQLSRGTQLKAALASSLAYHPHLIMLDEPFSGLDALVRDEFIQGLLAWAGGATILISSHDLAEVESFVSHVGYLDAGHIQFSEELASLSEHFREIEITLESAPVLPSRWPSGWLTPQTSAAVVRFVDSEFDAEGSARAIRELFPTASNVSVNPMPLREIFIALAKAKRKAA
jgi:ABC-2 type transport system ATP-binding protein